MKKILYILIIVLLFPVYGLSQAIITFEKITHDFGTIKEEDGRVTYDFVFRNDGNSPLVINNVRASCGCTSPSWTKAPVEPGQTGSVSVVYNPLGRPGSFNKSVTVQSNATEENQRLTIKGDVIPKQKKENNRDLFPVNIDGLLLNTKSIEFNNIEKGTVKEINQKFKNSSNDNMTVSFQKLPKYVSVNPDIITISPQSENTVNFIFDSNKISEWSIVTEDFYIVLNNKPLLSDKYKLEIKANIVDDFSKMTIIEKRTAPIMELSTRKISLGIISQGSKNDSYFSVKNIGEKPLAIRKIINDNPEIEFENNTFNIRSGKTADIKLTVNTNGLKTGKYKRVVTLQTNDPENAFTAIAIDWEIK